MATHVNTQLRTNAKQLRSKMTESERFVWYHLRARRFQGFKFRRQAPLGRYVVDFVCFEAKLIVELDGGQHASQQEYDEARTHYLEANGFRVIRFWNHDVLKDWGVVEEVIWRALHAPSSAREDRSDCTPSPLTPLPPGERGTRGPLTPKPSPSGGEGNQPPDEGNQTRGVGYYSRDDRSDQS